MGKEAQRITTEIFNGRRVETVFRSILNIAVSNNHSVALWKNPFKNELNCLVNFSGNPDWRTPEIETIDPGFIFSPFENNDNQRVLYLGADLHIKLTDANRWHFKTMLHDEPEGEETETFLSKVSGAIGSSDRNNDYYTDTDHNLNAAGKSSYIDILKRSVRAIESGRFIKVVPSRVKTVNFRKGIHPVKIFLTASRAYPNSFISLISTPYTGTWLGASPEILISVEKNEIFRTSSVAGTRPFKPRIRLSDVAWTQKEIEEQALVSRYIINSFKRIRLREFEELGPKTVRAGNLLHLKTLFTVNMKETNFPLLGSVMLRLLHPTSAICGMPKEEARTFLNKIENYNRKFYSGYLGPVNIEDRTSLYVNIRCANIMQNRALFYAGAGVTADSVPVKEWKETEVKIQSIARFFK